MTAAARPTPSALVFHAGALGDFVLTWPLLRAMARGLAPGTLGLVASSAKARLAARYLGPSTVVPIEAEQRRFTRLWTGEAPLREDVDVGVRAVLTFLADSSTPAGRLWLRAAASMFPSAQVEDIGVPGTSSRAQAWSRHSVDTRGGLEPRHKPQGPIVVHLGAGSREKMWPIDRWGDLIARLRADHEFTAIAGEVEDERFDEAQRRGAAALGVRVIPSLDELAATIAGARLFIGADTGPTHLAAQLGIPTLALFGPTHPGVWSPVGPAVSLLAPGSPLPMTWLETGRVESTVRDLLRAPQHAHTARLAPSSHA